MRTINVFPEGIYMMAIRLPITVEFFSESSEYSQAYLEK
jgi:hypothetical protein